MMYQLVLQWSATSGKDYDDTVRLESMLGQRLSPGHCMNGHDFAAGEANIFILTDDPMTAWAEARRVLGPRSSAGDLRVAYRSLSQDAYTVLWPEDLKEFTVL